MHSVSLSAGLTDPMAKSKLLRRDFFARSVHTVAPELIGVTLLFRGVGGVIVEVEAYDHEDPAAHGFGNRLTDRNASMFLEGGHVYVYRSYGIHWCMNVVCGELRYRYSAKPPLNGIGASAELLRFRQRRGSCRVRHS